jgi:tripartite-type tricarboxylate transporter receptor subunit TctC
MECWNNGVMGIRELARSLYIGAFVFVAFLIFLLGSGAKAYAQSNFYQGKTITVVVGSAPGGLYDLWGRLFARTMGKYLPGNPNMHVQNMPGAATIVAAN